jgi:hypothetical protein
MASRPSNRCYRRLLTIRRTNTGAAPAEEHRTSWFEGVAVEAEHLQAFLDHALDRHGLVISAPGRALTSMPDLGLVDLCEFGVLDRIDY